MAKTILLADDSVTIQKVVDLTFMDEDYQVESVSDGAEAIELFGSLGPALVVADVHMPGADGYEVCRRVKEASPGTPVLLLVGTFEPFDEGKAQEVGADGHLKKPFDSQDLLSRVEELIAKTGEAPPPPTSAEPPPPVPPAAQAAGARNTSPFDLVDESPPAAAEVPADDASPFDLGTPSEIPVPEAQDASAGRASPFELEPEEIDLEGDAIDLEAEAIDLDGEEVVLDDDPFAAADTTLETQQREAVETETAPAQPAEEIEAIPVPPEFESDAPEIAVPEPIEPEPAEPEPAEPAEPAAAPAEEGASATEPIAVGGGGLSDDDVERIARRVAELVGEKVAKEVAWEVVPDLAEVVIRERLRELESEIE